MIERERPLSSERESNLLAVTDDLSLDPIMCQVLLMGKDVIAVLTPLQSAILAHLLQHQGEMVSYQDLHKIAYPESPSAWASGSELRRYELWRLQAVVQKTRRKLEEVRRGLGAHLQTIRGGSAGDWGGYWWCREFNKEHNEPL